MIDLIKTPGRAAHGYLRDIYFRIRRDEIHVRKFKKIDIILLFFPRDGENIFDERAGTTDSKRIVLLLFNSTNITYYIITYNEKKKSFVYIWNTNSSSIIIILLFFFTVMCSYYNNSVYAVCKITINTTTRRSHAFTRTTPVKFQRNIGSFFYRLYYRSSCCIVFASSENIIRAAETTMHAFKRTSPYILCYIIYGSINI